MNGQNIKHVREVMTDSFILVDGLATITKLKEIDADIKTLLLTGHGDDQLHEAEAGLSVLAGSTSHGALPRQLLRRLTGWVSIYR